MAGSGLAPSVPCGCCLCQWSPSPSGTARLLVVSCLTLLLQVVLAWRARGYVLGDLKGSNIVVDAEDEPRMIDFESVAQWRGSLEDMAVCMVARYSSTTTPPPPGSTPGPTPTPTPLCPLQLQHLHSH